MTSPVDPTRGAILLPAISTRQKVERILAQLPAQGDAVSQAASWSRDDLVAPVQKINQVMRNYGIEFELSDESQRTIIRVVDRESGELIRQIPPDEAMTIEKRLDEIRGRLLRWKV
ncbi:flagellar protein [Alcanivorax sp. N3-2A]|nr:flagellar protein [Alcanivorax sp. N3-2A]|tara:strand:+ start:189 stop:536 length:348 start_codon:yes stop_codon:yes gene_type:complete